MLHPTCACLHAYDRHTTGIRQAYDRRTSYMFTHTRHAWQLCMHVRVRVVQGRRCGHVRGRCMRMCEERVCLLRMSGAACLAGIARTYARAGTRLDARVYMRANRRADVCVRMCA